MSTKGKDRVGGREGSSRRDFLRTSVAVAGGLGLAPSLIGDSGLGIVGASAAVTDPPVTEAYPIGLLEVDSIDVWCLEDNFTDLLLASSPIAQRPPLPPDLFSQEQLVTEHGFAAVVTVERDGDRRTLLYDGGLSPNAVSWNMEKLGVPAPEIEAVVLSHGHIDHHNGMDRVIQKVDHQGLPLFVHPDAWLMRRAMTPTGPLYLPPPDRQHLEGGGVAIVETREPSVLLDGTVAATGEIPRVTPYETGFPVHQKLTEGGWVPDPMIWDDQALVCNLRDRGLVVVSGCAHAGVINTILHAQALANVSGIYAFIGGMHLSGPIFEPRIAQTVADLSALGPSIVVPAHCTGWKATHTIAAALPNAFIQNSVGTCYHLV